MATLEKSIMRARVHLRRIERTRGLLWFLAAYTGVWASVLGWVTALLLVCSVPAMLLSDEDIGLDGIGMFGLVLAGGLMCALAIYMAVSTVRLASGLRELRLSSIIRLLVVVAFPVLLVVLCILGLMAGFVRGDWEESPLMQVAPIFVSIVCGAFLISLGGFGPLSALALRAQPVSAGPGTATRVTLRQVLLLKASKERRRHRKSRRWRRSVVLTFMWAGLAVLVVRVLTEIPTRLYEQAAVEAAQARIYSGQETVDQAEERLRDQFTNANLRTLPVYLLLAFAFTLVLGSWLSRRLRRAADLLAPSIEDVRRSDARNPVLLLRSFRDEGTLGATGRVGFLSSTRTALRSVEERLTDSLWRFGPVIAVGRPGESTPPPGAARDYLRHDDTKVWQGRVEEWMDSADIIVLMAGLTDGIVWELQEAMKPGRRSKLLIVFSPWMGARDRDQFLELLRPHVPAPLPQCEGRRIQLLGLRVGDESLVAYTGIGDEDGMEATCLIGGAEIVAAVMAEDLLSRDRAHADQAAMISPG